MLRVTNALVREFRGKVCLTWAKEVTKLVSPSETAPFKGWSARLPQLSDVIHRKRRLDESTSAHEIDVKQLDIVEKDVTVRTKATVKCMVNYYNLKISFPYSDVSTVT